MAVVSTIAILAVVLTVLAIWNIERSVSPRSSEPEIPFQKALREVWAESKTRNFTIFVFLSMNAYFMQELIIEPYAGLVFGFTPGQSTSLSGAQNGGVFVGMLTVGIMATGFKIGSLRRWVMS